MDPSVVERILELLQKVQDKVDSLVDKINGLLDKVPFFLEWAVDKFRDLWEKAIAKLEEFWQLVQPLLFGPMGAPWSINGTAEAWNDVGAAVSPHVQVATAGELTADENWTGTAATAYKSMLGDQKAALAGIKSTFTDKIAPALETIASKLYTFYVGVVVALVALVAGIALATGEAVSILGLPAVPPTVILAVVAAIGAIAKTGDDLRSAAATASSTFSTLRGESTAYGPHGWPRATA